MDEVKKKKKKLHAKTERASGKSGSVEEIGFGLAQKDKSNEGKEAVGGSEGGRQRCWRGGRTEGRWHGVGRRDGGIRRRSRRVRER